MYFFLYIYDFLYINHLCNAPFWPLKLIKARKTKAEEVERKPANFYCQSSIFSPLVFPEASCLNCECCLFLNSSFMNHCPLLPLRGTTWGLDADKCQHISSWNCMMAFVVTEKLFFYVPHGHLSFLYSYGRIKPHASLFYSVPVPCGAPSAVISVNDRNWF